MAEPGSFRKKVFIVGPTESILTHRGNRHPALAMFLSNSGYEVEYLTSDFYHAEKKHFSTEEIRLAAESIPYRLTVLHCLGYKTNISVQRVISNILLSIKFFLYLLLKVNSEAIVILPSRPVEMVFAAALLRLLRGTSIALDIQDIWPDMLVVRSKIKRIAFRCYCNLYLYLSLRFIDKFFHVAPSFEKWLHRYAPKAKSRFIPLGFDADRWATAQPKFVKMNQQQNIRLVSVTQLQFQCDVMPVLEAILSRNNHDFAIIGETGKGQRYPEVKGFIDSNKIENVSIIAHVEKNALVEYMHNADIGIVPMITTSIPNKVFDYIASYLPLLVLGDNDSADFVKENNIGWSVPFDGNRIGKFLDNLSPEDINDKVRNIIRIRDRYDRELLHQEILTLIESYDRPLNH